ncbi:hypothetical protein GGH92_010487, partial [Coemansia sp. RSA 2673]
QSVSGSFSSTAAQMPTKHARHDSMIECTSSGGYADQPFLPASSSTAAAEAAAAAAAVAVARMAYNNGAAFAYSARRPTTMTSPCPQDGSAQAQYLQHCFDPLGGASDGNGNGVISLDAGMSMMAGSPMVHPHLGEGGMQVSFQHSSAGARHQGQHHHSRSLSFTRAEHSSHMMPTPLHAMPAGSSVDHHGSVVSGYFYDGLPMDSGDGASLGAEGGGGYMFSSNPIPSIPGVTASPKEQPRRLSVPDLSMPSDEGEGSGAKTRPRRQKLRFSDDLYTPMWVRNKGQQKEGFCDTCEPGKWLQLKNSAFWYHKQFYHGISSVSGRPFVRPLQVRHFDADIIEGLCHQCRQWVPVANAKRRNSVLWFRH